MHAAALRFVTQHGDHETSSESTRRQGMPANDKREPNSIAAQSSPIHSHYHLDSPGAVAAAALGLAVLRDGVEPVAHRAEVLRRRGFYQRRSQRLPRIGFAFGLPICGAAHENVGSNVAIDARSPFAAEELNAPMPHGFPQLRRTRERGIHAARKSKLSENLITGDVADVVLHTATVTRRDVPSLPHYACGTPERIAEKQTQQVEQMRTQHHHVLAASARVLFAEGPQFLHVPD